MGGGRARPTKHTGIALMDLTDLPTKHTGTQRMVLMVMEVTEAAARVLLTAIARIVINKQLFEQNQSRLVRRCITIQNSI